MKILDAFFYIKKRNYCFDLSKMPILKVPDATVTEGFQELYHVLSSNLMPPVGKIQDPWARPARKFPAAYLWDSAFISIAWKPWDPRVSFKILKPFVQFQDKDGRMPHFIFIGTKTSPLSNPPFLAWALWEIYQVYPNTQWLEFFVEPLKRFVQFRNAERLDDDSGLYFWITSYESGMDNSPRFTSVDESKRVDIKDLGAIDLNSEIIIQLNSLLKIMNTTNDSSGIDEILKNATDLRRKVLDKLWSNKKSMFGDLKLSTNELICLDTIASYFPLSIPDLPESRAKNMFKRLKDTEKYNSLFPLPTVAKDSPCFIKDMWRGPVWINTTYLVAQGLKINGEERFAAEIEFKTCEGVYKTWKKERSFFEFYDPDRHDIKELQRKKGNIYKKLTLGSKPVKNFAGWTAIVNTMIIEDVIGIKFNDRKVNICPHLPQKWMIQNEKIFVKLPFHEITLEMKIIPGKEDLEIKLRVGNDEKSFSIKNHETVEFEKI
ncbi:MAG: MGH1-like glycoside hydrolase domain-containing protein [Promethearchaeota archaeon]